LHKNALFFAASGFYCPWIPSLLKGSVTAQEASISAAQGKKGEWSREVVVEGNGHASISW